MNFNLSRWALNHQGIILYFMILFAILGVHSYLTLGQSEDPPFTFRVMVINTQWPGASAEEVEAQVTDRIEEKLQESANLDYMRSYSRPGESQVFFIVREDIDPALIPDAYYEVRKKVGDIRHTLPEGVVGPFFNDEFGDTFGNMFALTGPDFSPAELEDYAERVRTRLLRIPDVAKVMFFGVQPQTIEVRFANTKRSQLGVPPEVIIEAVQGANRMVPSGYFEMGQDRIYLRTNNQLETAEQVRQLAGVRVDGVFAERQLSKAAEYYRFVSDQINDVGVCLKEALNSYVDGIWLDLLGTVGYALRRIGEML